MLGNLRVVDLTKLLDPKTETRRCHLYRFNTGGPIPDFHTIMDLTSHLGTHCECPYHHNDDWPSVAELPLDRFMGRAIYVEIPDAEPRGYITPAMLDKYCLPKMKDDTIVIIDSPYRIPPFTEKTNTPEDKRLRVNEETAIWLLLAENITFLEVLKNLDELESDVFFMSYAPLPILGLDSCPVRAYAIEGLPGFTE